MNRIRDVAWDAPANATDLGLHRRFHGCIVLDLKSSPTQGAKIKSVGLAASCARPK